MPTGQWSVSFGAYQGTGLCTYGANWDLFIPGRLKLGRTSLEPVSKISQIRG